MVCRSTDVTLSEYINTAIRLDNLICQHNHRLGRHENSHRSCEESTAPMQMGSTRMPWEERQHLPNSLFLLCGHRPPNHELSREGSEFQGEGQTVAFLSDVKRNPALSPQIHVSALVD